MNTASNPIPSCKLAAATAAAVAACDGIDGVKDGVIEDPRRCTFDPKSLIGTQAGECGAFTQADADIIRKLWEGPRRLDGGPLWHGPLRGTDLNALAASRGTPLAAAGVWIRDRLAAVLHHAGSAVRLDHDHAGGVSGVLGSLLRAVRHRHRHRQSGPQRVPRSRRQDDRLARTRRSADHRRGHDRLLHARAAADGRREADIATSRACSSRPASRTAPAVPDRSPRASSTRWWRGWRTARRRRR